MNYLISINLYIDRFNNYPQEQFYKNITLDYMSDIFIKDELIIGKLIPILDAVEFNTLIYPTLNKIVSLTEEEFLYISLKYHNCHISYTIEGGDDYA